VEFKEEKSLCWNKVFTYNGGVETKGTGSGVDIFGVKETEREGTAGGGGRGRKTKGGGEA